MENYTFKYNLLDALQVAKKWKKQIIIFSVLTTILTAIVLLLIPNKYQSYGAFYPSSTAMRSRANLMRPENQQWLDFMGDDNEVDKTYIVAMTSDVTEHLIKKFELAKHYDIDTSKPKAGEKIYKRFLKNYKVNRTGFDHLEVMFTDEDKMLTAKVTNEAMNRINDVLRNIYTNINSKIVGMIETKRDSLRQHISVYTDSLVTLRKQYGVYDIVSPSRKNLIIQASSSHNALYAEGLEKFNCLKIRKTKWL
ncbi:MAG: hypothetical protein R2831_10365 [Chitinophagaceae bacterium]